MFAVRSTATKSITLLPVQAQHFNSLFGGIFGRKKQTPEPQQAPPVKEEEKKTEVEPAKYHKESLDEKSEDVAEDIKQKIRQLDRTGQDNLFGKYQRVRKTVKERNSNLEQHLHPSLLQSGRVSIEKYENNKFKRGLQPGETAFPISPKVGPYLVERPIFGAKNYYWCACGLSGDQPFCDASHKGTSFKPIKFSLDEKSSQLHLCGCKFTTEAPFCDGETCKKVLAGERFEAAEAALEAANTPEAK